MDARSGYTAGKPATGKRICLGILAHVDAGKTTLSEGILYLAGSIRTLGRVDHQDAFLDNFELERARGITIFSKQAELTLGDTAITLLDTPGHVDFSAEMERTLQVLDYAVLVISGSDGVQGHTETLWRLLERYGIPTFLFVNKMDQKGTERAALMEELTKRLDGRCVDFGPLDTETLSEESWETLAMCDETLLDSYMENGTLSVREIADAVAMRKVFPCYFGSALKLQGVQELLEGIRTFSEQPEYSADFGARVFKITRDAQGNRLTHMKITGGTLRVKAPLRGRLKDSGESWEQKVDQIRVYSGSSYQAVPEVEAGMVCAVTGLEHSYAGEGLGIEKEAELPLLEPVLSYRIKLPPESDVHHTFLKLRELEEEEPQLHLVWNEQLGEIHAHLMGEVQTEVLKSLILERFGIRVELGQGNIVYKETIRHAVEGMGHYEPLRHYAEVHLLLEPGERGSGLQFESRCSEDVLDRNWQRLILTHLEEKQHRGVLTGSEITDMRITLLTGRAHLKHTEGGDFRQATYRAVRHGLKCAESVLLEPIYAFRLEVPSESVGRAMADVQRMNGSFAPPETDGETAVLVGQAPVSAMWGYQTEVLTYTKGRGRLSCSLKGYEECHNAQEVIDAIAYDSEADLDNPTGSVFCAHGAGFVVSWEQVQDYMHVDSGWRDSSRGTDLAQTGSASRSGGASRADGTGETTRSGNTAGSLADDKELEAIFARTYGAASQERRHYAKSRRIEAPGSAKSSKQETQEEYLLVDGYNIIFAWDELKELARETIEGARGRLADILSNYQGCRGMHIILVFDAYKVEGGRGEVQKYHNIHIVYTKEAETADQYIEKTTRVIGKKYHVTVATSDALEQIIILGAGASRMSANGLHEEVEHAEREIRKDYLQKPSGTKHLLFDELDGTLRDFLEELRLGRRTLGRPDRTE